MPHLPLVPADAVSRIDAATVAAGTPGETLMARAGRGVWQCALSRYDLGPGSTVAFLCGRGNNGGDGFVAALAARRDGLDPQVILYADDASVSGDARTHLDAARAAGVSIAPASPDADGAIAGADVVFDALLGTGLSGPPRPPFDAAIASLRARNGPVVAVDLPSGLDADTGEGEAARADLTVTFGVLKRCHAFYPGRRLCGNLAVVDIGLSAEEVARHARASVIAAAGDPALPERSPTAHKGDAGRVSIIAGSVGMTGAACLTSLSALRAGAGLVTLGIPASLNDIAEVKLTEVMTRPLPEVRRHRCLSLRARGDASALFEGADAVAIGPGIGRHRETSALVRRLIRDLRCPAVVDADALNALAGHTDDLREARAQLVLTPHPGEFTRLTGQRVRDPIDDANRLAAETGAIVVLKGAPTVVALPGGGTFVNVSGNEGMATGGAGDVLTGMIAALIAQGDSPGDAAVSAVYWHGLAGDLAAEAKGKRGLVATDLVDAIPGAGRLIERGEGSNRYVDYRTCERNG